jgi:hypothetical protein
MQKKTGWPARLDLNQPDKNGRREYLKMTGRKPGQLLFAGPFDLDKGLTTRQYARLVQE